MGTPIFELPEEKRELRKVAREFLEHDLSLNAVRELDEADEFPWTTYRTMAEMGWLGLPFPEEYGGAEGDALDEAILVEEIARVNGPLAGFFIVCTLVCGKAILDLGTAAQRDAWLPGIADGSAIFALALTEPDAGSDAAAISTRAIETSDGWKIDGQKMWCTAAMIATHILVVARTNTDSTTREISMFVVPKDAEGVEIVPIPKLGCHTVQSCMVFLESVEVPKTAILGAPGQAWRHTLTGLNRERLAISAMCSGMAAAPLEYAIAYAEDRHQFGVPIASFDAIQDHLAEMMIEVEAARTLMLYAAHLESVGRSSSRLASMAKLRSTEAAVRTARLGIQILGGVGYANEYPMQRYLRDALVHTIAGGSTEIMKNILSSELLRERVDR